MQYNTEHGITPQSIKKDIRDSVKAVFNDNEESENINIAQGESVEDAIDRLTKEMFEYAHKFEFEKAAVIRDLIADLKNTQDI